MPNCRLHIIFAFLLLMCNTLFAQDENKTDKNFWSNIDSLNRPAHYYFWDNRNQLYTVDTSIVNLDESTYTYGENEWQVIGNTGLAAYALSFPLQNRFGFKMGMTQFDPYRFEMDKIRFFEQKRPFTQIRMDIGLERDMHIQAAHAQKFKNGLSFGVDYHRINSQGYYQNQKSNDNCFNLYLRYQRPSNKWETNLLFTMNNILAAENGGFSEDIVALNETAVTKELYDVYSLNGKNHYRDFDFKFIQRFNLGTKYNTKINDSTEITLFQPRFAVDFALTAGTNLFEYYEPGIYDDSVAYYKTFDLTGDSLKNRTTDTHWGAEIWLNYLGYKQFSTSPKNDFYLMNIGLDFEQHKLKQSNTYHIYSDLALKANFQSNPAVNSKLNWMLNAKYGLFGFIAGELTADVKISYPLRNWLPEAHAGYSSVKPGYRQMQYDQYPDFSYTHLFSNVKTITVGASILQEKWKLKVYGDYFILNNYVFMNDSFEFEQLNKSLSLVKFGLIKNFEFKHIHLDNEVKAQWISDKNSFALPNLLLKHSLYYQNRMFKKKLEFSVGIDLRYKTNYYSPGYNPVLGYFYEQRSLKERQLPVLDAFINFKVKTMRFYFKGINLTEGLGQLGNYAAYRYMIEPRNFRGGVMWRFLD